MADISILLTISNMIRTVATLLISIIAVLWRTFRRNGLGVAIRYLVGGEDQVLYRAIWRGMKGKVGKDYENK